MYNKFVVSKNKLSKPSIHESVHQVVVYILNPVVIEYHVSKQKHTKS